MKQKIEETSNPWEESAKKQHGRFRIHGLYDLIKAYQSDSFFSKYSLYFKTSILNDTPRNYVMIDLPKKDNFNRHISIDAVFVKDSTHLSPYHLTRMHPFEGYMYIEHAYMIFDESTTGGLEWSVNKVVAHKLHNHPMKNGALKEKVILSNHEEHNIRQEAVTEVRPVLQELQRFKAQCMRELSANLSVIEKELSLQWPLFYSSTTTLTRQMIGALQDLIVQKKDCLEKIHLFSNHVRKNNQGRDKPMECLQAPFLNAMINMLDDRLKRIDECASATENILTAPPVIFPMSPQKAKKNQKSKNDTHIPKTATVQKLNTLLMSPEDIRASLKILLQDISGCSQIDLASLNERCLLLTEECENVKKSKDILQLFQTCESLLEQKTNLFNEKLKSAEKLIDNLENVNKQIIEKEKLLLNVSDKLHKRIQDRKKMGDNEEPIHDKWLETVTELCEAHIPVIKLTWEAEQSLLELQLNDPALLQKIQKRKPLLLDTITKKIRELQSFFPFLFHSAMIGLSVEALETLHWISPAAFNDLGMGEDHNEAYPGLFNKIFALCGIPFDIMSERDKESLKKHMQVADFLYENQANYHYFFQKHALELHLNKFEELIGILPVAIHHSHFDIFIMFLRHGLSPEAIQYSYEGKEFNIKQYLAKLKQSSTLQEQEYLSFSRLIPCSDNLYTPESTGSYQDALSPDPVLSKKPSSRFFDYGYSLMSAVQKNIGSVELPCPDHVLIKKQITTAFFNIISSALHNPVIFAIFLSCFLEQWCPYEPASLPDEPMPTPGR